MVPSSGQGIAKNMMPFSKGKFVSGSSNLCSTILIDLLVRGLVVNPIHSMMFSEGV